MILADFHARRPVTARSPSPDHQVCFSSARLMRAAAGRQTGDGDEPYFRPLVRSSAADTGRAIGGFRC